MLIRRWTLKIALLLCVYASGLYYFGYELKKFIPLVILFLLLAFVVSLIFICIFQAKQIVSPVLKCQLTANHYYISAICSGLITLLIIPWIILTMPINIIGFFGQIFILVAVFLNIYISWRRKRNKNNNTFANSGRWHTPVCHCK